MSKIGKKPIVIPDDVKVEIQENKIMVSGKLGYLEKVIPKIFKIDLKDKILNIYPSKIDSRNKKQILSLWGTWRSLIQNMIEGVNQGFQKNLIFEGIGFKVNIEGQNLVLNVGFSHPVKVEIPSDIKVDIERNLIKISGIDKEKVGNFAAKIRKIKPPEPYKGKGIRYEGEVVRRKMGKKAAAGV